MIYILLAASLALLAFFYHRLLVRCLLAEEKVRSQEEVSLEFKHMSEEAYAGMLRKLEGQLRHLELERKSEQGALKQQLYALVEAEQSLRQETSKLAKALRSPAGRGRWGEIQLRRVVELAGMLEHCDFIEQGYEVIDGTRRKPDLIVKLPGERQVIIDAKVPLDAYLEGVDQLDETAQQNKFKQHARQLKEHIGILGKKNYWEFFQPTPEFVVLFLPSETIFSIALETDPTLMEVAAQQGVIMATPMTLIALLKAVAYGWKQETLSLYAEKVSELGQELYKRISDLSSHWNTLSRSLTSTLTAFNQATGSLERNVLSSARKFQDLGAAKSTTPLPTFSPISDLPRTFVAEEGK